MGKSACGKDTIYKILKEDTTLGLHTVVPYTTRQIRFGETDGVDYHFCTDAQADAFVKDGKVIEMRAYQTVHGIWRYFTADDGQIDLEQASYLVIGTLESFHMLAGYFGSDAVVPLYVWVEDGERLSRALTRERLQHEPKYAELCRRFLADVKDFSEEKLSCIPADCRFENHNVPATAAQIAGKIRSFADRI